MAIELTQEIGRRSTTVTEDTQKNNLLVSTSVDGSPTGESVTSRDLERSRS